MVVAGLTERDGDRIYNSAVLIGQDGALFAKHRKITSSTLHGSSTRQGPPSMSSQRRWASSA
jgi:predicted amidohydrolase